VLLSLIYADISFVGQMPEPFVIDGTQGKAGDYHSNKLFQRKKKK
jgi:hypothetical protein